MVNEKTLGAMHKDLGGFAPNTPTRGHAPLTPLCVTMYIVTRGKRECSRSDSRHWRSRSNQTKPYPIINFMVNYLLQGLYFQDFDKKHYQKITSYFSISFNVSKDLPSPPQNHVMVLRKWVKG